MLNKEKELNTFLIAKYGKKQIIVAVEELSELQKELCKYLRSDNEEVCKNKDHIIEEISDTLIMINQLKDYFAISEEEIEKEKEQKTERTIERIKNGNL